jgi:predicted nucleic acid-binding protein
MRVVLDASAAVCLVMRLPEAVVLAGRLQPASQVLAPALFHAEVANALWKYVRAGAIGRDLALERLTEAGELLDDSIPDAELTTEALAAADQYDHPVYDLLYAVIARRYGCTVLTRDKRLGGLLRLMDIPVLAS